jgi:hypothetical protein
MTSVVRPRGAPRTARAIAGLAAIAAIAALGATAAPAAAGTGTVSGGKQASALAWYQRLSGSFGGRNGAFTMDAAIRPVRETEPGAAISLKSLGSIVLDLSYTPLEMRTRFRSSGGFTFGGVSFAATGDGQADYRMPVYEVGLRYVVLDNRWFRLCAGTFLKVVRPDVTLTSGGRSSRYEMTIPVPMAGLSAQVNLTKWLKLFASGKFLDLDVGPVRTAVDDYEGGIIYDWNGAPVLESLRFAGGYRRFAVDFEANPGRSNEFRVDVAHEGPFAELTVPF